MFIKFDLENHKHISLGRGVLVQLTKEVYEVEKYPPQEDFFIPMEIAKQYIQLGFAIQIPKPQDNRNEEDISQSNENTNRIKSKK